MGARDSKNANLGDFMVFGSDMGDSADGEEDVVGERLAEELKKI